MVESVARALERRGATSFRLDTDRFPSSLQLSAEFGGAAGGERFRARQGGRELEASSVDAVWCRRVWRPALPEGLSPAVLEGARRESTATLAGWLGALEDCRWINPRCADQRAQDKLLQLRTARRLGLDLPRTLVTNDPQAVRELHGEVPDLVAKMLTPFSVSMDGRGSFVHTSPVRPEDLEALAGLSSSPMVFQENIPKQLELRVTLVGARAFVGAIDASGSAAGGTDWRLAGKNEARWEHYELPPGLLAQLVELTRELGLIYGAIDLILTPDGRYVFLEINPAGEWGMLEAELELPIADALAEALLEPVS